MLAEIERFVNWTRRRSPAAHTWRDYRCDLQIFCEVVGDRPLSSLTFREIDQFIVQQSEQGFKPATINRRLALLDRAAFYLLWQTGMRLGEVEDLRLEDLDFPQKRLSVRDSKGRKDRTVYLTETAMRVLQAYLEVRGEGSSDHVFLYRHASLSKDLVRSRLNTIGKRVSIKVYPHRLRHTCATQLLNAGCRVTSIQRFLGHKELNTTMIYARAHDQTVADDYFAAMQRVEQRLQIGEEKNDKVVKVQEQAQVFQLIQQLETPVLCLEERLVIASQLRAVFRALDEHPPPTSRTWTITEQRVCS